MPYGGDDLVPPPLGVQGSICRWCSNVLCSSEVIVALGCFNVATFGCQWLIGMPTGRVEQLPAC
jgi:hypothetical protein